MSAPGKRSLSRRVVALEAAAFALIVAFIWLDELLDLPALLLGARPTPANWPEALLESAVILILGALIIRHTARLFARMKHLEGLLPICAACKMIRDEGGRWQAVETYLHERSEAEFSHGICPDCAGRLYPDCNPYATDA